MNKIIIVILLNEAEIEFKKLNQIVGQQINEGKENSDEMQLLKSIKQKIEFIKSNPFYGDNNLWRVELSQFWRMIYTIKGDKIEIVCFILDIFDHDKYNKKFRYRKN